MIPLCYANGWIGNWPDVIPSRLLHVLLIEGMKETNSQILGKPLLGKWFWTLGGAVGVLKWVRITSISYNIYI